MIQNFLYSIAGKKANNVIDQLLDDLITSEYTPIQEKKVLSHCVEVARFGSYPTADYFTTFYDAPSYTFSSLAEIQDYVVKVRDFYERQAIQKKVLGAINEATTSADLRRSLGDLSSVAGDTSEFDLDAFQPVLYSEDTRPSTKGVCCGVPEIDEETNGFQDGSIAAYAAFTGHGKSTFTVSTIFKNALEGKKNVLVSLEVAPNIIWTQFQARYLYQVKGIQVTAQEILQRRLDPDREKLVNAADADFKRDICANLLVVDESVLNKKLVTDVRRMTSLFKAFEKRLGGLDLIAFDHVGQFELLYPDQGNQILKCIQSTIKTYYVTGPDGQPTKHQPACVWAVQCNREGQKRAEKKGVYDLQAIADLHEVERSASYILFLYTSDDDKIRQETRMTLSKHRFGGVLTEPITTGFNPGVCTVGTATESLSMSDDDFNNLGDFSFDDGAF